MTNTNFTPRPGKDDFTGLSFSLKPPAGKFSVTTVSAINATGVLIAVVDGSNHCSVKPRIGSISDWSRTRPHAEFDPHPFTVILKSICKKPIVFK